MVTKDCILYRSFSKYAKQATNVCVLEIFGTF